LSFLEVSRSFHTSPTPAPSHHVGALPTLGALLRVRPLRFCMIRCIADSLTASPESPVPCVTLTCPDFRRSFQLIPGSDGLLHCWRRIRDFEGGHRNRRSRYFQVGRRTLVLLCRKLLVLMEQTRVDHEGGSNDSDDAYSSEHAADRILKSLIPVVVSTIFIPVMIFRLN
jgi:hypothetical protein